MEYNELLKANNINTLKILDINGLLREPRTLVPFKNDGGDKSDMIFDLLMDSSIRRGDGLVASTVQNESKQKIKEFVLKNEPINFVFQGFPFKCHNPVETLRRTPDLGELATLQRLMDINETVKQIYPLGVKFTVLTEGTTYLDLFGATKKEAEVYQKQCNNFVKFVGGEKIIQLVDFLDLIDDKDKFAELSRLEESLIREPEIEQFTPVMMRSMPIIENVAFEDLLSVFGYGKSGANLTDFEKDFKLYIQNGAEDLAIRYLAIQKVKKKYDLINSNFPDALYVSTTAKQDRYSFHPIHRKTRLYAHHGVPVLGSDKVDIVYFGEIITHPEVYTAVYLEGDIEDVPFYFLKGKQHIKKQV